MPEQEIQENPSSVTQKPIEEPKSIVQVGIDKYRSFFVGVQFVIFLVIAVGVILGITAPQLLMTFFNVLWIFTLFVVIVFLLLGGMVMVGLKNEAQSIMATFMEGTLTIINFMDFVKLVIRTIIQAIKDVILFLVPVFAYIFTFIIYILLLILYKWVGARYDVALMTVGLTVVLVGLMGIINKPKKEPENPIVTWGKSVQKKFKDVFGDAMEVLIFVFFLTMDSTSLFFLPKSLNVELHANAFGYNLMERGWVVDQWFQYTMTMIMVIIVVEVIRFGMRIVWGGMYFYKEINQYLGADNPKFTVTEQIKHALRQSFDANKDDIIKLTTYMTILIFVFLAFPRLKLLSMAASSITMLVLDLTFRERLSIKRGNDLIGRIISKVFNV